MTPGARVAATIELLDLLDKTREAPSVVINAYFRQRRYAGSKDRRAISDRTYEVLRHRARLGWWVGNAGLKNSSRARLIAALSADEDAEVEELFSGLAHSPAVLDEAEQALAAKDISLTSPDMPADVALEVPPWLSADIRASLGDAATDELEALNQPAPVDLRINTLKADRATVQETLSKQGPTATPTPYSSLGLRLSVPTGLQNTEAFKNGDFEIQDEGSQIASLLCDAQPGMAVADVCAGAGGKSLALAANMNGQGLVDACDISSKRLSKMGARLSRSGAEIVRSHVLGIEGEDWFSEHQSGYDRVLVDAPCSGSGTWRRDPLAKWRLRPKDLESHVAQQTDILRQAAVLVKSGGRLIYITCSLLAREGEDQIARFLDATPGFKVMDAEQLWPNISTLPFPGPGPYLRLSPAKTGTDGFFVAILEFNG
jgi:16S rRNA (cytosine967-C5)-methyltransferase